MLTAVLSSLSLAACMLLRLFRLPFQLYMSNSGIPESTSHGGGGRNEGRFYCLLCAFLVPLLQQRRRRRGLQPTAARDGAANCVLVQMWGCSDAV